MVGAFPRRLTRDGLTFWHHSLRRHDTHRSDPKTPRAGSGAAMEKRRINWDGKAQQLAVAQLVKHYFGLLQFRNAATQPTSLVLLYLFWEPQNWEHIAECKQHRIEVEDLASKVAGSAIKFRWMSSTELWQLWTAKPRLFEHARTLKERYETSI